jgi:hypothetical protein
LDGVLDLTINGGETFLHSDLAALISEAASISNIVNFVIVTNGTIVPSDEILKLCADNSIRLRVSLYGEHSSAVSELINKCKKFGVSIQDFHRAEKWHKLGTKKHNRADDENRKVADNCPFNCGKNRRILGLYKGSIHMCDRYDGLSACGYIDDAYYNDLSFDLSVEFSKSDLQKFLLGETLYKQCDMCNWPMDEIPPGVQINNEDE